MIGRHMVSEQTNPGRAALAPRDGSDVAGMTGFRHGYATTNGAEIHYVTGGSGPAVVLLHGFPYTWAFWRKLMPQLVAAGHTVIVPDLRGLGDSERVEHGYSKAEVAEDVRQVVKSLGFDSIDLVAADIGSMVAYAYASRHPGEVRHFVFTESLIPGFGLEELMNPSTGGYWHFGFHAQVEVATMLTEGKEAMYLMPFYGMMSTSPDAAVVAAEHYLPHYGQPRGLRQAFRHYETLVQDGKDNRTAFKTKLPMPVLVLNGARGIPQAQTAASIRQVVQDPTVELVPDAGHALADDNPDWMAERLARFFHS